MKRIIFIIFLSLFFFNIGLSNYQSTVNVVGLDSTGKGVMGNVTVEIQPGKGRILVDTKPLQGIYTQDSQRIAVEVARDITKFNFSEYDVVYSIATGNANVIDGPSAGGALALATIAAIQKKEISPLFAMTGTIEEDGKIGHVGGVLEKTKAAAEYGIKVFLIPKGQGTQNEYIKKIRTPKPGWYIETIEPVKIDLKEYAKKNWGMEVYEVSNIQEVMKYGFQEIVITESKNISSLEVNGKLALPNFSSPVKDYNDFFWMVKDEIERAKEVYGIVTSRLSKSDMPTEIKTVLGDLIKENENILEIEEAQEKGYWYSSANEAFKFLIILNSVNDVIDYYSSENKKEYLKEHFTHSKENLEKTKQEVIKKTEGMICSPEIFEWAVAAQQRITYAENRMNSIDQNFDDTEDPPLELFYKINSAKEWIEISKNFMKKTFYKSTDSSCLENFKELAEKSIREAENQIILKKSAGYENVEDAEWYLNASKKEFEQGWYIASIYDAVSAKTRATIGFKYQDKELNDIIFDFNKEDFIPQGLLSTIFIENAHYNIYLATEKNSKYYASLAIQTLILSKETNRIYLETRQKLGNPNFKWVFDFEISQEDYIKILETVTIGLLILSIILIIRIKRLERFLRKRKHR